MSDEKFNPLNELSPHRREAIMEKRGLPDRDKDPRSMPLSGSQSAGKLASSVYGAYKFGTVGGGQSDAGGGQSGPSSVRMIPRIYSPLFELSNLQLPRDRRTLNAWCRHFFATHPLVRNCITLHSTFPISRAQIVCEDKKIEQEMQDAADDMRLMHVMYGVSLVYWLLGESFPYGDWDEDNKTWRRWVVHNPDYVDVKYSTVTMEPQITLQPDDTLKRIVKSNNPKDARIRATLPREIVYHILRGTNIPLDNFHVTHVKALSEPYDHRGTSIIASCFKDLMLYDLIRESEYAMASNMINPLTLVKLGDPLGKWRPTDGDIKEFQDLFVDMQYDLDPKIITHGAVQIEKIGNAGGLVDTTPKMDRITKNIMAGLMVPEGVITGEGPNYCHDAETETLTADGWKTYDQITDQDFIATYNQKNGRMEYHPYQEKIVSPYQGPMIHFSTHLIDTMVTPNHKMLVRGRSDAPYASAREWKFVDAVDVQRRARFLRLADWKGHTPKSVEFGGKKFSPKALMHLIMYIWSRRATVMSDEEGRTLIKFRYANKGPTVEWRDGIHAIGAKYDTKYKAFVSYDEALIEACVNEIGLDFFTARVPRCIFDWDKSDIWKFLELVLYFVPKQKYTKEERKHKYVTKALFTLYSKQQADDLHELFFKCGYSLNLTSEPRPAPRNIIYLLTFTRDYTTRKEAVLDSRRIDRDRVDCKRVVYYDGTIYCFTVPNHAFITRRNGRISIHGNSTASVGLEVLRQRYLMFRDELQFWLEKKVFRPMAISRDWATMKDKEKQYIVPRIQWNKLNLKDLNEYMTKVADGYGKHAISRDSYLTNLDLDPDEEYRSRRKEMIEDAILKKEHGILTGAYSLTELRSLDENSPIEDRPIPKPAQPEAGAAGMPGMGGGGDLASGLGGAPPDMGAGLGAPPIPEPGPEAGGAAAPGGGAPPPPPPTP